jgi:hypothetical protein
LHRLKLNYGGTFLPHINKDLPDDMASNFRINIVRGCGLDSFGSRQKPVAGFCEHSDEPEFHRNQDILLAELPSASSQETFSSTELMSTLYSLFLSVASCCVYLF